MTTIAAIGTRKGLWLARSSDDRRSWDVSDPMLLMQEVPSVAFDTRGGGVRLLAGGRSEHWGPTVWRSDDLGASWQETTGGSIRFPAEAEASLERVWQLTPDSDDRPGVVWAGCEPTSLWRSADGGENFELVRGLWDHPHRPQWAPGFGGAAVHTVLPDPASERVLVAMSTGGVYTSDDGLQSWQPHNTGISAYFLPDPQPEFGQCVHKVAADATAGRFYAQNHHGVYRSDDAGAHWTSIADGLPTDFGFTMLAHPTRSGTAWVVPIKADGERVPPDGRLRVPRTDDGGATWSPSRDGLPDDCWVAVLRDAACVDDQDPAGVYLGTRDGAVYASADEGETFQLVASPLPDVLVVRAVTTP
jgi:hypothetical protein